MSTAPLVYQNWKAAEKGGPSNGAIEHPFYTDSRIVGQIREGLGPYQLLNTGADETDVNRASIILRQENHSELDIDEWQKAGDEHYHGGQTSDAIAALLSLSLGMRVKAGAASREFEPHGDPRGRPVAFTGKWKSEPNLPDEPQKAVLPEVRGKRDLNEAVLLSHYSDLTTEEAICLLRAARLYQDAVWIVDSEPQLSWLMMVSAVESVADQWWEDQESPVDSLKTSLPELYSRLEESDDKTVVEDAADLLAHRLRSTKKFISFLLEFEPGSPKTRPQITWQLDWSASSLKDVFSKVYDRRSRALHDGKPFPYPMCVGPLKRGGHWTETPYIGGSHGASWSSEEAPILLHTFEYIMRNAILSWWRSVV